MIKYDFKCEICQGKFDSEGNIPRVLQCGHTICSKCVDRMKSKNMTRCPFDRKIIDPDDDKIAINYYILHLIDGSIKDSVTEIEDKEEVFELSPKPVVNSPGWKNTLDGFIHGDILYTVESNGFIYCTDLNTGEWWFLYLNVFYGKFFFKNCNDEKNFFPKMYMLDQYGNLFQMFNKNYYTQFGKKGSWKNTSFLTVFKNKMYSLETTEKLYETDLTTGVWKEIVQPQNKNEKNKLDSNTNNLKMVNVNDINDLCRSGSSNLNNLNNLNNNASDANSEVSEIILPIIDGINSRNRTGSNNSNNLEEIEPLNNNNFENEFNDDFSNNENEETNEYLNVANENINGLNNGQFQNQNMNNEGELQSNVIEAENIIIAPNYNYLTSTGNNNNSYPQTNTNFISNEQQISNRSGINQSENNINIQLHMRELGLNNNLINNLSNQNNSLSHNSNNSNNNAEYRPNRFLDNQDNRRFDIELSDSSSIQVRNLINNPNNNVRLNQSTNILNNELNNRNFISAEANLITPIKNTKTVQGKPKKLTKKVNYDFSNAIGLFSTSEYLYFINKKGEVFTVSENSEITLESKTFSKNIDCFATNSTHIYFYEKDRKHIYKASLNKNFRNEQEEKISYLNKLEIEKKIFSDFNKEENSIFLANNNFNKFSYNFSNSKNMENKTAVKKYSFELNEPILNISTNICRNCQCAANINNEEMKNEEKLCIKNKEQEGVMLNPISEINYKNKNLVYKVDIEKQQINNTPNKSNILLENTFDISYNKETNNFTKFIDKEKEKSYNIMFNQSDNLGYNQNNIDINIKKTLFLNPRKLSTLSSYLKIEKFYDLDESIIPTKLICDDKKLVIIDKNGELTKLELESKLTNKFQCLFMLRNCHLNNSVLIGDGDLILLDPVRLSLNKLNILTGTEIIILHSVKFLSSIKYLFTNNSKIYLIDTSGNLYNFNEFDKKIIQIGGNGLCKYIIDFSVHKNYIFTIENNSSLYRTNLNDGIYKEYKNDYVKNYSHFLSDHQMLIFITKDDNVNIIIPTNEELTLKKQFKFPKISKFRAVTLFKKQLIFYNLEKKTIESINLNEEKIQPKVLVQNFGEVLSFINNNDCLACIIKDCVIYKLYC
jgi:hypothetical protein